MGLFSRFEQVPGRARDRHTRNGLIVLGLLFAVLYYAYTSGNIAKNAWAFLPVYPLIVRAVMLVTGLAPILLLLAWEVASKTKAIDPLFFPAPTDLWSTGTHLWGNGQIEHLLGTSFRRVLEGFFLGSAAGLLRVAAWSPARGRSGGPAVRRRRRKRAIACR